MSNLTEQIEMWLESSYAVKRGHGLQKIVDFLQVLGNPHRFFRTIHIAGTNGKGSTVAYTQQLFIEHGLKVGAFVSPHMISYHDRILIDGQPIDANTFNRLATVVWQVEQQLIEKYGRLSYFEIMTVIMFLHFKEQQVNVAIVEVGIGGLQDVTNCIDSAVSAITSIGLDHQLLLGDSLEEIAIHKSGIFKSNSIAVIGPLPPIAQTVCQYVASAHDVKLVMFGSDFTVFEESQGEIRFVSAQGESFHCHQLGLAGSYQKENAAVALEVFLQFCYKYAIPVRAHLVEKALTSTSWPGRMEVMVQSPTIVIDGAHNIPAVERLIETIEPLVLEGRAVSFCFGALKKKDFEPMLKMLANRLPQVSITIVSFAADDAIQLIDVQHLLNDHIRFESDYQTFLTQWQQQAQPQDLLFVTGSLYFIAEVRTNYFKRAL